MLGKLLKYEIKASIRYFLPIWIITLALSVLNKEMLLIGNGNFGLRNNRLWNSMNGFMIIVYMMMVVATFICVFIVIILRFYRNFLSEEGYLTFTLPVKTQYLISSKLIVAFLAITVSIIVTLLSIFIICFYPEMGADWKLIWEENLRFFSEYEINYGLYFIGLLIVMILSYITYILQFYVSIAIGQLWRNHKVLGAFLTYFVIQFVIQIIVTLASFLSIFSIFSMSDVNTFAEEVARMEEIGQKFIVISGIGQLVLGIIFFVVTTFIFNKKLNLD